MVNSNDERNQSQILRIDGRNCFVEVKSDSFEFDKVHLEFATYDMSKPAGQRYTNHIHIYVGTNDWFALCCEAASGALLYQARPSKDAATPGPLYECLGGTSATKLTNYGRARADKKSLSRVMKLLSGKKADFLLIADSGPGEENATGLIVPRWGQTPENHVAISLDARALTGMLCLAKAHYEAWLSSQYLKDTTGSSNRNSNGNNSGKKNGVENGKDIADDTQMF